MDLANILKDDSKLYKLLNEKINNTELLKLNFSLYLSNKNNNNKFIIDLDNIWKWLGYSQKVKAKKVLEKNFILDIDYKIILNDNKIKNGSGGHNKEIILLTTKCFKTICLLARTSESRIFYDYYIILEETITEYLENKLIENNLNLNNELNLIKQKYKERIIKGYVYIFTTDKNNYYKCGRSINLNKRIHTLQTSLINDIKIIYYFYSSNAILLENIVHKLLINYKCNNREHFNCNYDILINIIYIFGTLIDIIKNNKINELTILDSYIINHENNHINIKIFDYIYLYLLEDEQSKNLIIKLSYNLIKTKNSIYSLKSKNGIIIYKLIKNNINNINNIDNIIKLILFIDNIINLLKI